MTAHEGDAVIGHTVSDRFEIRRFDRRLFAAAAVAFPIIVLAGFARTYYVKALFASPPLPSILVHLHGLLMTAWVLLFMTQVWFISSKRIRLHQQLGYVGIGLAAFIISVALPTALRAAKYGSNSSPPGIQPLAFLAVPLFDLLMFIILFGGAVYFRRRPAAHKTLMLLTAINFLGPAVARIPISELQAFGPLWFFGLPGALAVLCLGLDTRRNGRMNKIFLAGTILLLFSYVVRLTLMTTPVWMTFATWATSFV